MKKKIRHKKTEEEKLIDRVKKAYRQELSPWERKYISSSPEEFAFRIEQTAKAVKEAETKFGQAIDIRKIFRTEVNALSRHTMEGTRRDLFKILKSDRHYDYNHLNTYLYRLGYSVSNYWADPNNSTITVEGSEVYMSLNLPPKTTGQVVYSSFKFGVDYSSGEVIISEFN